MNADLCLRMRTPNAALETCLLKFLRSAKNSPSARKLASEGLRIDPSVKSLLNTFPNNVFWSVFRNVRSVDEYSPDKKGVLYEIEFTNVKYPLARKFAEELKTWISAIGCTDVSCHLTYNYSQPTRTNILNVTGDYKSGNLAVFVGAGVSRQAGLPLWEDLLNALAEVYGARFDPGSTSLDDLQKRDVKERARWLKKKLGTEFTESVRQALYRRAYRDGLGRSRTIETLSKMKLLKAVCNYNYDDLLERRPRTRFEAVASAKDRYVGKHIPVYHVHGLLPFVGSPRGELILSEDDYNRLANTPMHWSNVVQVNLLRECTCLLIGMSCTDPNLRRILDLVGREKAGDTYIVQKMQDIADVDASSVKTWSTSKEFDTDCFAELGLRTIWINSYDELPDILQECMA